MRIGFDNEKYLHLQSEHIRKRIEQFGGKLYMELGGKLFDDYHASRVLPGFAPDSKIRMLETLKEDLEVVIVINANDIEKSKVRGDLGIAYDEDALRLSDNFQKLGISVSGIVIAQYAAQPAADAFIRRLSALGVRSFKHYPIPGYPSDIKQIVSDEGYGRNEYIETTRSLVVVTAPGPGSGKMATCLSQLYHDYRRGTQSGYAKFETFPVWNMPLSHPVNLAYEAATVDLHDVNMIDPYHLEAYGKTAVNYNRDIEIFPVLRTIFDRILGTCPYSSPTDMGVNMLGFCIADEEAVEEAAKKEIVRRYFSTQVDCKRGKGDPDAIQKLELLMNQAGVSPDIFPEIDTAQKKAEATGAPAAAMLLPDGTMITGKTSAQLGAASSLLLNALKHFGGINKEIDIISSQVLEPICHLKTAHMGNANPRLHSDEVLIALSICAVTNPVAEIAMEQIGKLSGCDAHFTVILSSVDEQTFKKLGINVSCQPVYESQHLYHK